MKSLRFFTCTVLLCLSSALFGGEYAIDSGHAFVSFTVNHLGFADSHGRFNDVSGSVDLDSGKLSVTIKTDSIDTGQERRDKHLRSPDFFNAKQFPEITFSADKIKAVGEKYEVLGKLTMNGVTKDISMMLKKTGEGKDPWGNQRLGLMTSLKINRMDYGIAYMPEGLGKEVSVHISVEAVAKK